MSALQLPILNVEAKAELLANNLPEFEKAFREGIAKLNYELLTDDDFKKAKEDIKTLKQAQDTLKEVDDAIVNGSLDIKKLRETVATLSDEARQLRLAREKEVKRRDAELKQKIIDDALGSINRDPVADTHIVRITNAIKSKRSLDSMQVSASGEAGIINMELKASRDTIERYVSVHGKVIAPDADQLELRGAKELTTEFTLRIERIENEKEKARLKAEAEKAKQEAEEEKQKAIREASKTVDVKSEGAPHPMPGGCNEPIPLKSVNHFDTRPAEPTSEEKAAVEESAKQIINDLAEGLRGDGAQELQGFCELVVCQFGTIRDARQQLLHPDNKSKAEKFAQGVNHLYNELKGGA